MKILEIPYIVEIFFTIGLAVFLKSVYIIAPNYIFKKGTNSINKRK